jgi:hypothetical protein
VEIISTGDIRCTKGGAEHGAAVVSTARMLRTDLLQHGVEIDLSLEHSSTSIDVSLGG